MEVFISCDFRNFNHGAIFCMGKLELNCSTSVCITGHKMLIKGDIKFLFICKTLTYKCGIISIQNMKFLKVV